MRCASKVRPAGRSQGRFTDGARGRDRRYCRRFRQRPDIARRDARRDRAGRGWIRQPVRRSALPRSGRRGARRRRARTGGPPSRGIGHAPASARTCSLKPFGTIEFSASVSCAFAALQARPRTPIASFDIRCLARMRRSTALRRQHPEGHPRPRPRPRSQTRHRVPADPWARRGRRRGRASSPAGGPRARVAVVLISEDLDELLALSDRIAVMTRGRLLPAEPWRA